MKYELELPNVANAYGAQMGRREYISEPGLHVRTHLTKVPLLHGYDRGGVYWGEPDALCGVGFLYCAEFITDEDKEGRCFIRAWNRITAKTAVLKVPGWENVTFYK